MPSRLRGALTAMLSGVAVVRDLSAALDLVAARPQLRAVTADGDLVGAGWVSGGSDRKPSTLEITSEVEKARDELAAAEKQTGELSAALSGALAEQSGPPGRRRAGAGRAQRVRCRDLGDLRTAGQARPGRPHRRRRMAAADPSARRAGDRSGADRRGARRARAAAAQRRAGAVVRCRTGRTPGDRRGGRDRPRRRGGGPADGAHRRRAGECRSRAGGFVAPRRGGRTGGQAAGAARAGGPRECGGVAAAVAESGRVPRAAAGATVGVASRRRDALAAERHQRIDALAKAREQVTEFTTKIAASPRRCTATKSPKRKRHCGSSSSNNRYSTSSGCRPPT